MSDLFDMARIDELATLIRKYQDSYYNGEGEISDAEFDKLWDELKSSESCLTACRCGFWQFCKNPPYHAHGEPGKSRQPGAIFGLGKNSRLRRISC